MHRQLKLATKILLLVLALAVGTGISVFLVAYTSLDEIVTDTSNLQQALQQTTLSTVTDTIQSYARGILSIAAAGDATVVSDTINRIDRERNSIVQYISKYLVPKGSESLTFSSEQCDTLRQLLNYMTRIDPHIYRIRIATEAGYTLTYTSDSLVVEQTGNSDQLWYSSVKAQPDKTYWYSDNGFPACIAGASLCYSGDGAVIGVITADILISDIMDMLTYSTDSDYFAILISESGKPVMCTSSTQTIVDLDTFNIAALCPEDQLIAQGYAEYTNDTFYMMAIYLNELNWSYCVFTPISAIHAPAEMLGNELRTLSDTFNTRLSQRLGGIRRHFFWLFAFCLVLTGIFSWRIAVYIRKPIRILSDGAGEMGKGRLDTRIEIRGTDELSQLGTAFNNMAADLQTYIEQMRQITCEKERTRTELNVARHIQTGMLPSDFPAFPEDSRFDIFASMRPAREVGGDFYDFFKLDNDHLVLTIADVSGKGIPAALFMVVTRTLIKDHMDTETPVNKVLERINDRLVEGNPAEMFVTVWLAIVDLRTGQVRCANAGHEYPILRTSDTEALAFYRDRHGLVLGGMEGTRYREYELTLQPGGCLLVYTDGVTEAHDGKDELFGNDRTLAAAGTAADGTPEQIIRSVESAADRFAGERPQFDDMTLLCFKRLS